MTRKKVRWINVAKALAIFAVLTDHLHGSLYSSEGIQRVSFFSVALFILLMGVTTFWSYDNSEVEIRKKVGKRITGIITPYVMAVFCYHFVSHKGFYWNEFVDSSIKFNASAPHYYVLLYIQLLIISPVVFYLIERISNKFGKRAWIVEIIFMLGYAVISWICNTHTDIADIYAGKLFSGSYILCLYIGMLFGRYYKNITEIGIRGKSIIAGISIMLSLVLGSLVFTNGFVLDAFPILGSVINPPGVTEIVYALVIMVAICFCGLVFSSSSGYFFKLLVNCILYIGEKTLHIFLYHRLFLDYFLNKFCGELNIFFKIPLFYIVMIFGSIAIEYLYKWLSKMLKSSYSFRRE